MYRVWELDGESVVDVWELRDDEDELIEVDLELFLWPWPMVSCIATAPRKGLTDEHSGTVFSRT